MPQSAVAATRSPEIPDAGPSNAYETEARASGHYHALRLALRQIGSIAPMARLTTKLDEEQREHLPKSKLGNAIGRTPQADLYGRILQKAFDVHLYTYKTFHQAVTLFFAPASLIRLALHLEKFHLLTADADLLSNLVMLFALAEVPKQNPP
jgi:hypothetical protein